MSFFSELKRRNVFKVAIAYIVTSWLVAQVAELAADSFGAPDWVMKMFITLLALGLPFAIIFAWAFEMTPEGLKREKDVDRSQSITSLTSQKLNHAIIVVLVLALAYFVFDKFVLDPRRDARLLEAALDAQQQGPEPADSDAQTDHKSIAVLPFQNRSANAENAEFFADGVHDEILTMLSKISDLKVISRTSVMSYRDTAKTMQQIGEELGVATVLEGGVQRAGDMLRINVQLIDTTSDQHLWAEVMDRQLTAQNIFEIQSDIAKAIANELHATLSPREKALISTTPTTNLEAYENLLIARRLFEQENWQDLRDAQTYLQRAIDIDPGYVQAYTLLARTYSSLYRTGATTLQETRAPWEHAVQTALSLDDQHAGAHAAYAEYLWATGQEGVIGNFEKARELEPANVDIMVMYGRYLYKSYFPDQALPLFKMARELDPVSTPVLFGLARVYHALGETDEALEIYTRIRTINPSSVIGYGPASGVHMELGYWTQSTKLLYQAVTIDPEDSDLSNWIALAYLDFGDLARARGTLAWIEENQKTNPMTPAGLAVLSIYQDDIEKSYSISQRALDERQPSRWGSEATQVRALLIWALDQHQDTAALKTLRRVYPELFERVPTVNADNVLQAIDTAHLLMHQNSISLANELLQAAIALFDRPYAATDIWHAPGKAQALALLGKKQEALDEIRRQVEKGWRHLWFWNTRLNPNFESLQDDPAFNALVESLRADMTGQYEQLKALEASGELKLPVGIPQP